MGLQSENFCEKNVHFQWILHKGQPGRGFMDGITAVKHRDTVQHRTVCALVQFVKKVLSGKTRGENHITAF